MELLKLRDVFVQDDITATFHIPPYQRGYSWETKHRTDLLSDIDELTYEDRRHFAGTLVVTPDTSETNGEYEVVDGQQRLTSLILLMELLLKTIEARGTADRQSINIDAARRTFVRDHSDPDNTVYRLNPQKQFAHSWETIVTRSLDAPPVDRASKTERNLEAAVREFKQWLSAKTDLELASVYAVLTEQLGFLMYTADSKVEVGVMFEVINNRGKPLSQLEKLKNYVLYYGNRHHTKDLIETVERLWPELLRKLSSADVHANNEEDSFLRNCWILFRDPRPRTSHHPADRLKESCPAHEKGHASTMKSFVELLNKAASVYQHIRELSGRLATPNGSDRMLQRIALHPSTASILPIVLAIKTRSFRDPSIEKELLDTVEKLNFRYYVAELAGRSDSGQKHLFDLSYSFYWDEISAHELRSALADFAMTHAGLDFFESELALSDESDYDYHWWAGLKFFLASYEEYLREEDNQLNMRSLAGMLAGEDEEHRNDFFHKEHVWARRERTYVEDHIAKRRLGNFILLYNGLNKSVSNKTVEEKLTLIHERDPNTLMVNELDDDWTAALKEIDNTWRQNRTTYFWIEVHEAFCAHREKRYLEFAKQRWMLSEEAA